MIELRELCNEKYPRPFTFTLDGVTWNAATTGQIILWARSNGLAKTYEAKETYMAVLKGLAALSKTKTPVAKLRIGRYSFIGWAKSTVDGHVGTLCKITVDKRLLWKALRLVACEPKGMLNITGYDMNTAVEIIGPRDEWRIYIMPLRPDADAAVDTEPVEATEPAAESAPVAEMKRNIARGNEIHTQVLASLSRPNYVLDRQGRPVNKWGDVIRPKYS